MPSWYRQVASMSRFLIGYRVRLPPAADPARWSRGKCRDFFHSDGRLWPPCTFESVGQQTNEKNVSTVILGGIGFLLTGALRGEVRCRGNFAGSRNAVFRSAFPGAWLPPREERVVPGNTICCFRLPLLPF